jgi:hypothetical protein
MFPFSLFSPTARSTAIARPSTVALTAARDRCAVRKTPATMAECASMYENSIVFFLFSFFVRGEKRHKNA